VGAIDKDALLEAIRSVIAATGGNRISRQQFLASSGLKLSDIFRYFSKWSDALAAASFSFDPYHEKIIPEALLTDWGLLVRKLRRIPTRNQYKLEGQYSPGVFARNFGPWSAIPERFRHFAVDQPAWTDVVALLPAVARPPTTPNDTALAAVQPLPSTAPIPGIAKRHSRLPNRPTYGDPIDFRGLRHAPVNEDGVVCLFGMVARELGYLVEAVQAGFPDCEAKRQIAPGQWQRVRIEFEFESRNFQDHGHAAEGCDIIVCWVHNWAECPAHLEIVELKAAKSNSVLYPTAPSHVDCSG
jgi:hypothetical protein